VPEPAIGAAPAGWQRARLPAMKSAALALAFRALTAEALLADGRASTYHCLAQNKAHREVLQARLATFGVVCEKMCKTMGSYPNCQCPGFNGQPASEGDLRGCSEKYCQDPSNRCPNDAFVNCVKEVSAPSLLQWDTLMQHLDASFSFGGSGVSVLRGARVFKGACHGGDESHRALIQTKLAVFGVECEEMCKRLGMYPNCQCPGFAGQPASDGDTRKCSEQNCQDPSHRCPNDAFVTCVEAASKVSLLEWGELMHRLATGIKLWQKTMMGKVTTVVGNTTITVARNATIKVRNATTVARKAITKAQNATTVAGNAATKKKL